MTESQNFIQIDDIHTLIYALKYKAKGKVFREFYTDKKEYDDSIVFLKEYWQNHFEIMNEVVISPLSLI